MAKVKGYIFSRKFMEERVPQNIQNLTIKKKKTKRIYRIYALFNSINK